MEKCLRQGPEDFLCLKIRKAPSQAVFRFMQRNAATLVARFGNGLFEAGGNTTPPTCLL